MAELDIDFTVSGEELKAPGGSFTQVNPEQNELLIEKVLAMSEVKRDERLLDLFCGVGNLSLPLAKARER